MTQAAVQTAAASDERTHSELEKLLAKELTFSRDLPVVDGVVIPRSAEGIYRLAQWYVTAGLVPDSLKGDDKSTVARVAIAISAGLAAGLTHTQAVSNVMVVNNKPTMWGDALVAVVRRSAECVEVTTTAEKDKATCRGVRVKRLVDGSFTREVCERSFTLAEAQRANLTGKGPWRSYPERMMLNRARAFVLRDLFADLLMGIGIAEEEQDIETHRRDERAAVVVATAQAAMTTPATNAGPALTLPKTGTLTPATPAPAPASAPDEARHEDTAAAGSGQDGASFLESLNAPPVPVGKT